MTTTYTEKTTEAIEIIVATLDQRLMSAQDLAVRAREEAEAGRADAAIGALGNIQGHLREAQALYEAAVAVHRGLAPRRG